MNEARGKTSLGLKPNVAGLPCYVLWWVSGLILFLLENKNRFVRFHAIQSIVTFGAITVVNIVLSVFSQIPFLRHPFRYYQRLVSLFAFVLRVVLMVKAYQGQRYKLPIAGDIAAKQS